MRILKYLFPVVLLSHVSYGDILKEKICYLRSLPPSQEVYLSLAKANLQDQNHQEAIESFLKSLIPQYGNESVSKEELSIYEEAFDFYQKNYCAEDMVEVSNEILLKYKKIVDDHPNYFALNYLLAAAYANLGQMENYFDCFLRSYKHLPDHFLAYKGKAILHLKLFGQSADESYREIQRERICQNAMRALELYAGDKSLYRLVVTFASSKEKRPLLNSVLQKIIDQNIMVSREDALFYLEQALSLNEILIAKKFLGKAKQWYPQSRGLTKLQASIER